MSKVSQMFRFRFRVLQISYVAYETVKMFLFYCENPKKSHINPEYQSVFITFFMTPEENFYSSTKKHILSPWFLSQMYRKEHFSQTDPLRNSRRLR